MNEPRPTITSARPPETASRVEKRWNTRTASSELTEELLIPGRPAWLTVHRTPMRSIGPQVLAGSLIAPWGPNASEPEGVS